MQVPTHLRNYLCDDYFESPWSESGYWCEKSQLVVIVPAEEVKELADVNFLAVGRAGADGIRFGYRLGMPGLWAFYPIEQELVLVAASVSELVQKWVDGPLNL
jgi:hypothetical protein